MIAFSPFLRARQTAEPLLRRFPSAQQFCLPIQEFTYLDWDKWKNTTYEQRRPAIEDYWSQADPHSRQGPRAESFADLIDRAEAALAWLAQAPQPAILVCHGLFMGALIWRCRHGSREAAVGSMSEFRAWQPANSIPNLGRVRVRRAQGQGDFEVEILDRVVQPHGPRVLGERRIA